MVRAQRQYRRRRHIWRFRGRLGCYYWNARSNDVLRSQRAGCAMAASDTLSDVDIHRLVCVLESLLSGQWNVRLDQSCRPSRWSGWRHSLLLCSYTAMASSNASFLTDRGQLYGMYYDLSVLVSRDKYRAGNFRYLSRGINIDLDASYPSIRQSTPVPCLTPLRQPNNFQGSCPDLAQG